MIPAIGYAASGPFSKLKPVVLARAEPGEHDVRIDVLYCGVCHSDIHQVKNEWGNTVYPCMPGHEIVGRVAALGASVTRHAIGDLVGVGCMIDSCRACAPCLSGEENYCEGPNSWLATYNGPMVPAMQAPDGRNMYDRDNTFGGYSTVVVVHEDFVLRIPPQIDAATAAPILCAGVTTYSPMKHWKVGPGQRVGIVGFGGLGDMAAKIAKAMGAEVVVFTTTRDKVEEGKALGLRVVLASDRMQLKSMKASFDFILSTVPEKHDVNPFVALLKRDRTMAVVGALGPLVPVDNQEVAFHRKSVAGSLIGSLADTQEVLDFCAGHGIGPDVEVIAMQEINAAFKKVEKGDVRFRYVIDMATMDAASAS